MSKSPFDELARAAQQSQQSLFSEHQSLEMRVGDHERARRRALRDSGVLGVLHPHAAAWIERDGFPRETHAMRLVRDFYHQHSEGERLANILVLMGLMGVGKTFAVAWLLARPRRSKKDLPLGDERIYRSADELRFAYQRRGNDEFKRICAAGIAVIDELGTEGGSPEDRQNAMREFITLRTGNQHLLSVLVSNVGRPRLCGRYDARTVEKINERARWRVAGGPNLRKPLEGAP